MKYDKTDRILTAVIRITAALGTIAVLWLCYMVQSR